MKDKLFLLSEDEVNKYLTRENRVCMFKGKPVFWWLRSTGRYFNLAMNVDDGGGIVDVGNCINLSNIMVRPALHLNPLYLQKLKKNWEGLVKFAEQKWLVLDEEKGLLLSKKVVCRHRFDLECNEYKDSEIRKFLNEKVLPVLFNDEEQDMILETIIDGEDSYPVISDKTDKPDDLIRREDVLTALEKVFAEHKYSYGEKHGGFAADVPQAIKSIPSIKK